jgi:ribosomal protein S18 acetylase RimI-like enzyme
VTDSPDAKVFVIRPGLSTDEDACVALWVAACAARDGRAFPGVAERARAKFLHVEAWLIAETRSRALAGFVLVTTPGSGLPGDPPDAPLVALLAVDPAAQRSGLGARLLFESSAELEKRGHEEAVLHALVENRAAVRLYESAGWAPRGAVFEHSLLKRPMQAYVCTLQHRLD